MSTVATACSAPLPSAMGVTALYAAPTGVLGSVGKICVISVCCKVGPGVALQWMCGGSGRKPATDGGCRDAPTKGRSSDRVPLRRVVCQGRRNRPAGGRVGKESPSKGMADPVCVTESRPGAGGTGSHRPGRQQGSTARRRRSREGAKPANGEGSPGNGPERSRQDRRRRGRDGQGPAQGGERVEGREARARIKPVGRP